MLGRPERSSRLRRQMGFCAFGSREEGGGNREIAASQSVCVFVFPYAQRKEVTTDITMHVCIPGLRRNRHAHAFMHDLVLRPGAGMNELQALILKPLYVDGRLEEVVLSPGNR